MHGLDEVCVGRKMTPSPDSPHIAGRVSPARSQSTSVDWRLAQVHASSDMEGTTPNAEALTRVHLPEEIDLAILL